MAPGLPAAMDRPHFIGIGGAGMSGIARIMLELGVPVSGSDAKQSHNTDELAAAPASYVLSHGSNSTIALASTVARRSAEPCHATGATTAPADDHASRAG